MWTSRLTAGKIELVTETLILCFFEHFRVDLEACLAHLVESYTCGQVCTRWQRQSDFLADMPCCCHHPSQDPLNLQPQNNWKSTLTHCHILQWEVRCFALYAVAFCHQTCWWSAQTKGLILGLSDYNSWYLMALGEVKALHCISCNAFWWIPNCSRCEFSVTTLNNCISWYFSSLIVYALYPLLHLCNSKPSIFSVLKFFQVPPR